MPMELFSFLGFVLTAINTYMGMKKKTDSNKFALLKDNMGPLLEELDFCKKIHNKMQDFYVRTFPEFLKHIDKHLHNQALVPIVNLWKGQIQYFHDKEIRNEILNLLPSKKENALVIKPYESEIVPIIIKSDAIQIQSIYPVLLENIKLFEDSYNSVDNELIKDKTLKNFTSHKDQLMDKARLIGTDADQMIVHLVSILLFVHQIV